ncbi:hypothetical protein C5167_035666, partial [Papaver somniferum]
LSSASSSVLVADNVDLLRQILLCLPVKSLLKFKSVSKEWISLISDSHFVLEYHILQKSISPLVSRLFILQVTITLPLKPYLYDVVGRRDVGQVPFKTFIYFLNGRQPTDQPVVPFETLAIKNDPSDIKIIHSCNGLFVCSSYNTVNLIFDPLKSNDYEVVYIWSYNHEDSYQIEIYSSKTDSWKLCGVGFSALMHIFWNGSLHWTNANCSIYFGIDQETMKTMPPPPMLVDEWDIEKVICEYFGECNGHLYFIEVYHFSPPLFDIYEMDDGYTGWYAKYHVDIQELTNAYP